MISRQGETPLEKTIYVLKNMNLFDMSPFKEKEAYFRRLLDVANVIKTSIKEVTLRVINTTELLLPFTQQKPNQLKNTPL